MHGVNQDAITSLHTNIASVVRAFAETPLRITSPSHPRGWAKVAAGADINFEIGVPAGTEEAAGSPSASYERIERDFGGRVFVFRILPQPFDEPTLWAGWYEQWRALGDEKFDLVGLSWTFYWGTLYRRRKAILRAEWDSLLYRSSRAAQPHWHIDPDLLVDSYHRIEVPNPPASADDELIELPSEETGLVEIMEPTGYQELSLQGMHLAMGGWHHADNHPTCWRSSMPSKWNEITKWAERTLAYAKEQFVKEFRAKAPF